VARVCALAALMRRAKAALPSAISLLRGQVADVIADAAAEQTKHGAEQQRPDETEVDHARPYHRREMLEHLLNVDAPVTTRNKQTLLSRGNQ
jgi:hypothetical protein